MFLPSSFLYCSFKGHETYAYFFLDIKASHENLEAS